MKIDGILGRRAAGGRPPGFQRPALGPQCVESRESLHEVTLQRTPFVVRALDLGGLVKCISFRVAGDCVRGEIFGEDVRSGPPPPLNSGGEGSILSDALSPRP